MWDRAAESSGAKMEQSAKQLDVRKNVLPNGFDSSTENRTCFKLIIQKKEVAPFLVKNGMGIPGKT
jgi:hypothetical protein